MRLPSFEHLEPRSLEEALGFLAKHKEQAKIIAGGTELLVSMKHGLLAPAYLVNLKAVRELDFVSEDDGGLRIGALTRLSTLSETPAVRERFPLWLRRPRWWQPRRFRRWVLWPATCA